MTTHYEHHLSGVELVWLLVDVVSKNGSLLINVGPRADGTIPDAADDRPAHALGTDGVPLARE